MEQMRENFTFGILLFFVYDKPKWLRCFGNLRSCFCFVLPYRKMMHFFRPYELELDTFAKLWAAYEHEYEATVTTDRMEISDVVDNIIDKCHMAMIQITGKHCFTMELFVCFSPVYFIFYWCKCYLLM